MTPRFVVAPEVEADIAEAASWYELRSAGLGLDFVRAAEVCLGAIRVAPERFPRVRGDARRALLRRYPYAMFYRARDDAIQVVACMHTRRDPRRWQARLR